MPKLIIQRTSEYLNGLRSYGIYIDEQKVDTISNGETKELELNAGRHTLYFKIDWCSSPQISFEAVDNETKIYKVGVFKNGNWIMPIAMGIIVFSLMLKKTIGPYYFLLAIPPFLLIAYYTTIGRKKYLTLNEV